MSLQGTFSFRAQVKSKEISGQFDIKILYPRNYPETYPLTSEFGGRTTGFHINPDNTLCLGSPLQLNSIFLLNPCIENYLHNMLIPFLVRFIQFEKTGTVPLGELEHGDKGLKQYLIDLTGIKNECILKTTFELYLMNSADNSTICPCGSRKTFRNCHYKKFKPIQHIPHYLIREHLQEVYS